MKNSTGNYSDRNSGIEILRVFCIAGILFMHSFGQVLDRITTGKDLYIVILAATVLNLTSSCLMIISGYYGIRLSARRYVHLELICLFWSLTQLIIGYVVNSGAVITRNDLISHMFPVMTNRNWFVTGYVIIMIFAQHINEYLDLLDSRRFRNLLIALLLLFYVVPTMIYTDILNTGGKDVLHLFVMYVLGRYLKRFYDDRYSNSKLSIWLIAVIAISFGLNIVAEKIGVRFWFCRDCSLFMVAEAVLLFLIIKKCRFYNGIVNFITRNIISALLGESVAVFSLNRIGLREYIDVVYNYELGRLWAACILRTLFVLLFCVIVEKVRGFVFNPIESGIEMIWKKWKISKQ